MDAWATNETEEFVLEDTTDVSISFKGSLAKGYWGKIDNVKLCKLTDEEDVVEPVEAGIYVDRVRDLTYTDLNGEKQSFIEGVDVSSYVSLKNSGVKYYDFDGNELDDIGYFKFLASCGINYVRVPVYGMIHMMQTKTVTAAVTMIWRQPRRSDSMQQQPE